MSNVKRDLSLFTNEGYDRGRNRIWQFGWYLCSHLVFQPFWTPRFLRPLILRFFGAQIGKGSVIRSRVKVHWPWKLKLGDNVWVGEGAWLLNLENIVVGNSVCISQDAFICTGSHDLSREDFKYKNSPIEIKDRAWICARSIVIAGSVIPEDFVVEAGSTFRMDHK